MLSGIAPEAGAADKSEEHTSGLSPMGPTAEQSESVRRTWFGSWIGRATALVLMIAAYLAAIGLVLKFFWNDYAAVRADEPAIFWTLIFAPLVFILLFSVLPETLRLWRDRRLKAAAVEGRLADPGYFRLRPYEERDREKFHRLDGAHEEVLTWIRQSQEPLLYLTGASGSGKSSLVAAWVIPALEELGWRTLSVRSFDDPEAAIVEALQEPGAVWDRPPKAASNLRVQLEQAADYLHDRGGQLLIVVDQFEEFVILHDNERREEFVSFVQDFVARPVPGVRLLLILRSDYTAAIHRMGLPRLVDGENWQQIAPFMRDAAQAFLEKSGLRIPPPLFGRILKGLGEIEEAPGLYRPITLNMLGLVLARTGSGLESEPELLIQRYLKNCLVDPNVRDDAPAILGQMITDAGTKRPRGEAELASATRLEAWRIAGCLVHLDHFGLVRPLDQARNRWEIGHDFLARLIGRLLGHLRPPLWRRALPWTAPVLLVLWIGTLLVGVPVLNPLLRDRQIDFARRNLASLGVAITAFDTETYVADFPPKADDGVLNKAAVHLLADETIKYLDLSDTQVSELEPLASFDSLQSLDLSGTQVSDLRPLAGVKSLRSLTLSGPRIRDLRPLAGLDSLQSLDLFDTWVRDLRPLVSLKNLQSLHLSDTQVSDISPVAGLKTLQSLTLSGQQFDDLGPLGGLETLQSLTLSGPRMRDLSPLAGLRNLQSLDLFFTQVSDLRPLTGLMNLQSLDLRHTQVNDLGPLRSLKNLQSLTLSGPRVTEFGPLAGLKNLQSLDLYETQLRDLGPLVSLKKLQSLELSNTQVRDLEPLAGAKNLQSLGLSNTQVRELGPLVSLEKLQSLDLSNTQVHDLEPLAGLESLQELNLSETEVSDLSPLAGLRNLQSLDLRGTLVSDEGPVAHVREIVR